MAGKEHGGPRHVFLEPMDVYTKVWASYQNIWKHYQGFKGKCVLAFGELHPHSAGSTGKFMSKTNPQSAEISSAYGVMCDLNFAWMKVQGHMAQVSIINTELKSRGAESGVSQEPDCMCSQGRCLKLRFGRCKGWAS